MHPHRKGGDENNPIKNTQTCRRITRRPLACSVPFSPFPWLWVYLYIKLPCKHEASCSKWEGEWSMWGVPHRVPGQSSLYFLCSCGGPSDQSNISSSPWHFKNKPSRLLQGDSSFFFKYIMGYITISNLNLTPFLLEGNEFLDSSIIHPLKIMSPCILPDKYFICTDLEFRYGAERASTGRFCATKMRCFSSQHYKWLSTWQPSLNTHLNYLRGSTERRLPTGDKAFETSPSVKKKRGKYCGTASFYWHLNIVMPQIDLKMWSKVIQQQKSCDLNKDGVLLLLCF